MEVAVYNLSRKQLLWPFSLTALIIILDQFSKYLVVRFIDYGPVSYEKFQRFFLLVHQKNTGVAFSLGDNWGEGLRVVLFIVLPLLMLTALSIYYFKTNEFSRLQRWALCGIIGGGLGNIIDRIFRPDGVIDFLSFRIYGLFGMERWPTFNVADASVVICAILVVLTSFFQKSAGHGPAA